MRLDLCHDDDMRDPEQLLIGNHDEDCSYMTEFGKPVIGVQPEGNI